MTRYRTIVADPPWPYAPGAAQLGNGGAVRPGHMRGKYPSASTARTYGSMTVADLCALAPPAEDDAHLYLWTTNAFMVEAHQVAEAWGFKPKTILTWVKTYQGDPGRVSGP